MIDNHLQALSPLDGRYAVRMNKLRHFFSEYGYISYRIKVEVLWFIQISEIGLREFKPISSDAKKELISWVENISEKDIIEIKKIESKINHDVKSVEYFLKNKAKKSNFDEIVNHFEFFHFCCTSEDINNISHSMMMRDAQEQIILPTVEKILKKLSQIIGETQDDAMLSKTHGQAASPTTMGKEIANFRARLRRTRNRLKKIEIYAKFNGAVGNLNAHKISSPDIDWLEVCDLFVKKIGFENNNMTTQIEPHDWIAEYCDAVFAINVIFIDMSRDLWGYISAGYFTQNINDSEVGSSTMPHKVNPIDFENAEGNLGIANSLLKHFSEKLPVSRFQRDLTDSTVIRNLGVAIGHSYLAYDSLSRGLSKISINRAKLVKELDESWEIVAEPIQTYLRSRGYSEPYERLKKLTRGNQVSKETFVKFIKELDISNNDKDHLLKITPSNYLGYASILAKKELEKD